MEGLLNIWHIMSKPDNVPIAALLVLVPFFTWLALSQAASNDAAIAQGKTPAQAVLGPEIDLPEKTYVWPYLLRVEFLSAILCMIVLMVWSVFLNAPLEEQANPNLTPNPSKAPWYFLGLQELLVYFDPWIAGVVLPTVIVIGLMTIPYIDVNPKGNGYYTWKERKFAVATFCFGFLIMWISLIIIGTFVRGPGWMWFWPWQPWDKHKVLAEVNVDLSNLITLQQIDSKSLPGMLLGAGFIGTWFAAWFVGPLLYFKRVGSDVFDRLGPVRYAVTNALFAGMMFVVFKAVTRQVFSLKYVLVTPWFNI